MFTLLVRPLMAAGFAVVVLAFASPSMAAVPAVEATPSYEDLIARLDALPSMLEADAVYDAAAAIVWSIPAVKARQAEHAAVAALAAVLPDLMARAWDEGAAHACADPYHPYGECEPPHVNPYRPTEGDMP